MFKEKISDIKTYFSNGPKVLFIFMLILICTVIGIFAMEKNINMVVDGKEYSIKTYKSNVKNILDKNNIALGPKDIVEPDLNSKVKSGDTIKIKRAVNIQIHVDGKTKKIATVASNIKDMLKEEGIKLGEKDKISPAEGEKIKANLNIKITRVSSKVEKKVQPIEFTTVVKKDGNLKEGTKKVVQEGLAGKKELQYNVVYEDGKEVSRKLVSEKITKNAENKVVAMGTLKTAKFSRGGFSYLKKLKLRATAYTSSFKDTGKRPGDIGFGITASGTRTKRNPNGYSTVAVDPRVIPLGTKLYVENYGYAIAEDTGGAIKGNKIDLYFNTDSEVYRFGVRYVNIYVLK